MGKTILITGATSGIGYATAELLADKGYELILCGRRQERLDELQKKLSTQTNLTTLNFDVRDREAVSEAINSLPSEFSQIDVLINNAGNAHGLDPIDQGSLDDWDAMLDINVKGLLYVSRAVLPKMVERKSGHVINIGSIAGKEVYPKGNVYCASKYAVDAINKSMLLDLNQHGIRVGAINPGAAETEFSDVRFKADEKRASKVYEGFQPLTPKDVAEIIHFVITRPYHVNIADLVVMPTAQANGTTIKRQ